MLHKEFSSMQYIPKDSPQITDLEVIILLQMILYLKSNIKATK